MKMHSLSLSPSPPVANLVTVELRQRCDGVQSIHTAGYFFFYASPLLFLLLTQEEERRRPGRLTLSSGPRPSDCIISFPSSSSSVVVVVVVV